MTRRGCNIEHFIVFALVLAGLAFPLEAVALFCLVCIGCLVWMSIGASYFTLQFFYRGLRYSDWE